MLHTHTPHVAGFDSFGRTSLLRSAESIKSKRLPGANVHSRVQSLRREIRFKLKCLDRVTEAHAFNHPPRVVDIAAVKVVESCLASSWIFGVKRVASVGEVVSMGTL